MESPILRDFRRAILNHFLGIAIPCDKKAADGSMIRSEKVLKFNRKALRKIGKRKVEKVDHRIVGLVDTMIVPVGKPGSRERVEALRGQYEAIVASGEEVSPFGWKGE